LSYVLGVDAGNTKTIALVACPDGRIVGTGRGRCGDIYGAVSADAALAEIEGALSAALQAAGIRHADLVASAFSVAGADWPEDFEFLLAAFAARGFGAGSVIVNDALGALRAGSPDGTGVVIACGTGTAIGVRSPQGQVWHTSHWQEPQGSRHLADKTLRAVYRADLGIDPQTSLTARVLDFFQQRSVEDVLHLFTARLGPRPAHPDGLARVLLDEASAGDATARRLVVEHGAALGDYALAAARRVGIEGTAFPLVLTGGVFRHPSPLLTEAIVARVRTTSPSALLMQSRFEPAIGALFLALENAGIPVDEPLLARMLPTMPPASLFAT
jgi:N-acetylglucosamine kinase-like BadF-type ATPase